MLKTIPIKTIYKNSLKSGAGFTLLEMIVVIFIFAIISLALIAIFSNLFTASKNQTGLVSSQDRVRLLVGQIVGQIRNAQAGADGSYPLEQAGSQQLVFYSNADGNPGTERIRYFAQNSQLWRGITNFSGGSYNTSTEKTILVQDNFANSTGTPIFYYYDGSYSGSSTQSSLSQPVNVTQVSFIKINLQIYNTAGVNNTNTYTVTAGGSIRGLKTNLGQ